jgi:hypothetical protein
MNQNNNFNLGCNTCESAEVAGRYIETNQCQTPQHSHQIEPMVAQSDQSTIDWWRNDDSPYNLNKPFTPSVVEDGNYKITKLARDKVAILDKKNNQTFIKKWTSPSSINTSKYRFIDLGQATDEALEVTSEEPVILQAGKNIKFDILKTTNPRANGVKISAILPEITKYSVIPSTGLSLDNANRFSINTSDLVLNSNLVRVVGGQLRDPNGDVISVGGGTLLGIQNLLPTLSQEIAVTPSTTANTFDIGVNPDKLKTKCGLVDGIKVGNSFIIPDILTHDIEIVVGSGLLISQGSGSNQIKIEIDLQKLKTELGLSSGTANAFPTFGLVNSIPYSLVRGAAFPTFPLSNGNLPTNSVVTCTVPLVGGTNATVNGKINSNGAFVPDGNTVIPPTAITGSQLFVLSSNSTVPAPLAAYIPVSLS